jgi:glycosyltransferase involved in cell wall biosynthesis
MGSPAESRTADLLPHTSVKHFGLSSLPKLLSAARHAKPEVIFTYGGPETVIAGLISRVIGCKVVRFRGEALRNQSRLYAYRQRLGMDAVDLVLAPSERLASELTSLGPRMPVEAVTLGCDTSRFSRTASSVPTDSDRPKLLVFGRLDPIKGHRSMIQLMAQILRYWGDQPDRPTLHIVGEPANVTVAALEQETRKAGLQVGSDVVISTIRVKDVAGLLSSTTLGVVPSLGSEIICRVAEEFLLCGTPVAVSAAGSLPEVLFDSAGFCFGGLSHDAIVVTFVDWIRRSLQESAERKLARADQAKALFSLEAMADRLTNVLRDRFGRDFV